MEDYDNRAVRDVEDDDDDDHDDDDDDDDMYEDFGSCFAFCSHSTPVLSSQATTERRKEKRVCTGL